MTNSIEKGRRAERDAAKLIGSTLGPLSSARRGRQYKGTEDSPDIADALPGFNVEVKWREKVRLFAWWNKHLGECGGERPALMLTKNREPWLFVIRPEDIPHLAASYAATHGTPVYPPDQEAK